MVCTGDDLMEWKDFPKGLRVLLLDEDDASTSMTKAKLEELDYIVSTFSSGSDALAALASKPAGFHVAIIEANVGNGQESLKFLETNAKDLPIIMTSSIHCLNTTMKCLTLGAAEFLQKPLSEDKLRNLWQHVVHKAYNARRNAISKSLSPVKEAIASMLHLELDTNEHENKKLLENDRFTSAPSTPQLKQVSRLLNEFGQDQTDTSNEKDNEEQEGESKFVETTFHGITVKPLISTINPPSKVGDVIKEEPPKSLKTQSSLSPCPTNKNVKTDTKNSTFHSISRGIKNKHKKIKVDWTSELHKQFLKAVEQLGVEQAIPSRILELMKVEGLTRHNVASHLQKYRMHKKHIAPKEENGRWQHRRDMRQIYPQRPVMAYPSYHSKLANSSSQYIPVWGHPGTYHWTQPGYPVWQAGPAMHLDARGSPMMLPFQGQCSNNTQAQNASGYYNFEAVQYNSTSQKSYFDIYPAEEEIDKVVKETLSKPWLPLPLGLRPPSIEGILSELRRQGICNIPPNK